MARGDDARASRGYTKAMPTRVSNFSTSIAQLGQYLQPLLLLPRIDAVVAQGRIGALTLCIVPGNEWEE